MISEHQLETKIGELLDDFYSRRIAKISTLKLRDALRRKNPYLFRAIGVHRASEIVEKILLAYMSSSDEGIFGDAFFEPLAKFISEGEVAPSPGVDVAVHTELSYKAIAVKSGPSVFNAQSKKRQEAEFKALENRLRKLHLHFDPIVGYCYGNKKQSQRNNPSFRELAGQAFWEELTGDSDFYIKIIITMQEKPLEHAATYQKAFAAAINRFTKEFIDEFCDTDGSIDWVKLVKFNSGS